ncbi:putative UV radiation resistance associated protein [Hypsibius exemplaris]|uniref:UV radiation resistance associated protein n=1 Tax=Hypsibius exemplaris TaxID=2072580 RepID=A0A1W0WPS9_HYPEX|nr:putative UV radiation resistance associated protein [Hypsibius exemplaris]
MTVYYNLIVGPRSHHYPEYPSSHSAHSSPHPPVGQNRKKIMNDVFWQFVKKVNAVSFLSTTKRCQMEDHSDGFLVQKRVRNIKGLAIRHLDVTSLNLHYPFQVGFTLASTGEDDMQHVYFTSDLFHNSANPTWEELDTEDSREMVDLNTYHCVLTLFSVNTAASTRGVDCLLRWVLDLRALVRVGDHLDSVDVDFKLNTVVFLLKCGVYICAEDVPQSFVKLSPAPPRTRRKAYSPTSLRQLIKLEKDLSQVQTRRRACRLAVDDGVSSWADRYAVLHQLEIVQQRLQNFRSAVADLRKSNLALDHSNTDLASRNQSITTFLHANQRELDQVRHEISNRLSEIRTNRMTLKARKEELRNRQRELISDIRTVYPIHRSPSGRAFITGIWLPPVDQHANCDDMTLSASLGYAVHLTILLSKILNIPMRYPLKFFCSLSSITDPISAKLLDKEREFPLSIKKSERTRFHYGVYFFNLDIAQLRFNSGMGTPDLKKTLENLQTLIEEKFLLPRPKAESLTLPSPAVEEPEGGFFPMAPPTNGVSDHTTAEENGTASLVAVQSVPDFRRTKTLHQSATTAVFIQSAAESSSGK